MQRALFIFTISDKRPCLGQNGLLNTNVVLNVFGEKCAHMNKKHPHAYFELLPIC